MSTSLLPAVVLKPFGVTASGVRVTAYELRTPSGALSATLLDYGAMIQSVAHAGAELTLNYETLAEMEAPGWPYYGPTCGRVANRIAGAAFELDGATFDGLAANNGPNCLHGGARGFDRHVWAARPYATGAEAGVVFDARAPTARRASRARCACARPTRSATRHLRAAAAIKRRRRRRRRAPRARDEVRGRARAGERGDDRRLANHAYWNLGGASAAGGRCWRRRARHLSRCTRRACCRSTRR